jgi:hypothetical protein
MSARARLVDLSVRRSIEDEIERLISVLDFVEPDPDLEPSLGWTVGTNQTVALMGGASPLFLDGEFDGGDSPEQPDHY